MCVHVSRAAVDQAISEGMNGESFISCGLRKVKGKGALARPRRGRRASCLRRSTRLLIVTHRRERVETPRSTHAGLLETFLYKIADWEAGLDTLLDEGDE